MKTGLAILLTVGLIICGTILTQITKVNFNYAIIIISGLWAAWDSSKIELKKYKSGISYGPVVIFICHFFLWIIAFPWYLSMRYKIKNGLAQLK